MKRLLNILLPCCFIALTSCELFQIDNYDGPNATISGKLKDAVTGEAVETDIQTGTAIRAFELGWVDPPVAQTWVVKQNGEFTNNLIFAGRYNFEIINANVYEYKESNVELKKGKNEHDLVVTPYIRVKNASIKKEGNLIVATFSLEGGKPEVKVSAVRLYAHSDIYVGEQVKYDLRNVSDRLSFSPAKEIDDTVYTLTIDLGVPQEGTILSYSRNYYFRIGALASVSGVGTIRYNYAPHVVIPL